MIFFGPTCAQKKGQYGPSTKQKTYFCAEIRKADHKLSKTFHFKKISFGFCLCFNFFFFFFFFCPKRSFLAKTAVAHTGIKFGPNQVRNIVKKSKETDIINSLGLCHVLYGEYILKQEVVVVHTNTWKWTFKAISSINHPNFAFVPIPQDILIRYISYKRELSNFFLCVLVT